MAIQQIKFSNSNADFFSTLNKRVNEYFKTEGIARHANKEMIIKTIFMFSLYIIPYIIIMSGLITHVWIALALCIVMGLGVAGIGLSIMHDANHGAYSQKKWVNDFLGYSLNLVGGNAFNWKVQHNVLHHTYTNVHDVDEDISPRGILRMSPHGTWKSFHRFQFLYAWFFYGLMTFVWVVSKDFNRIMKYKKEGLIQKLKTTYTKELFILLATKVIYIGYVIVLPIVLLSFTWWQVVVGVFIMHYVAGFILAIVFQPAHVIDGTEYPLPDEQGNLENNWAIHQLLTTTNYANNNIWLSWYVGGLNFQIEHHLFPHVCHVHYRKLSDIVRTTASEFGLPYKSHRTFRSALLGHLRLLKELGIKPQHLQSHSRLAA